MSSWAKAFEYERVGDYRLGANQRSLMFAAAAVAIPAIFAGLFSPELFESVTPAEWLTIWLGRMYEWIVLVDVDTGEPRDANTVWHVTNLCFAAWAFEFAFPASRDRLADLRPNFLYPLSRFRQAQIRFWYCMRSNIRYVSLILIAFYLAILLCSLALGKTPVWSIVLPVIYPLAALYLTTPLVQIVAVCYLPRRYCQMLWMKVVCPWRDGAAEESVSGRPWLISMRLF